MTSFEKALAQTLNFEGGYSNDPQDSGGETMYGIIIAEARNYGYLGEMRELPLETAKQIYRKNYWDINHCEEISEWNEPIAFEVFDTGVNMGTRIAAQFFQMAINVMNKDGRLYSDIAVDKIIGPTTLMTMRKLGSESDKRNVLKILNILQGARYLSICESHKSQEKFIRGWLSRVAL
jgi:lysozyme family protein